MKRWLREDAIVDVVFVIGLTVMMAGAWLISAPHAMVLGGAVLALLVLQLRARR